MTKSTLKEAGRSPLPTAHVNSMSQAVCDHHADRLNPVLRVAPQPLALQGSGGLHTPLLSSMAQCPVLPAKESSSHPPGSAWQDS